MITADLWQVYAPETGRYLKTIVRSPGFAAGQRPRPIVRTFELVDDRFDADMWTKAAWERWFQGDGIKPANADRMRVVPAPSCGCCGSRFSRPDWKNPGRVTLVKVAWEPEDEVWRCEKHVGRAPCCIEGCGRTFAIRPDESYRVIYVCGKHWSLAPKWMRNAVARVRRIARRRGWDDQLEARHHRLWFRCIREVRKYREGGGEGHIDIAEIERLFG